MFEINATPDGLPLQDIGNKPTLFLGDRQVLIVFEDYLEMQEYYKFLDKNTDSTENI